MKPIVIAISADVGQMTSGIAKGSDSLAKMERDGKKLRAELDQIGAAGVAMQRKIASVTGIGDKVAQSARASAQAFVAFDAAIERIDTMRAGFDPLFAASKRYEQAVQDLDAAMEMGVLTSKQHADMLEQVGNAYLGAADDLTMMHRGMGLFGSMSDQTRNKIQQVGFQVQDFAVQVGSGTSATQAFAQQFPQLAGAFGPVGIAVGTLAAVGLPLLTMAFGNAGNASEALDERMSALQSSVQAMNEVAKSYSAQGLQQMLDKYGKIDGTILALTERQRKLAVDQANSEAAASVQALADKWDVLNINLKAVGPAGVTAQTAINGIARELGVAHSEAGVLVRHLQNAANATSFAEKAKELGIVADVLQKSSLKSDDLTKSVIDSADAMLQLAHSVPEANWLNAAISGAETLWQKLHDAVVEKARLASADSTDVAHNSTGFGPDSAARHAPPGRPMDLGVPDPKTGAGSNGGANSTSTELDNLRQSLMTQEEVQLASYTSQQELLQTALQQKLVTLQEYQALMEDAQRQHQATMSEIDVWRYGDGQQKAAAFFGVMADTFQSGNEKMQRMARVFGAAEALINAWRGYAQVIGDPTIPFMVKFRAAASVLAAGMGAVNAIKGGGGGSSSSHASSSRTAAATTASPAAARPANVNISWFGGMTAESMGSLTNKLNAEFKQGYRLNLAMGAA